MVKKQLANYNDNKTVARTKTNMDYYIYILTNKNNTVLYTGVTNDLQRRINEHKYKANPHSFSAKYNANKLVYYEITSDVESAIAREKQLKGWLRKRKNELVESKNPMWEEIQL